MAYTMKNSIIKILVPLLLIVGSNSVYAVKVNQTAPDFTLSSSTKQNIRLAEQRGQVIMLNFWATWCNPCRVEIPKLQKIYQQYKNIGFTVLGVNIDKNETKASKMARDLGAKFPILFDSSQTVSKLYSIKAMPFTLLIDRDGKVRNIFYGYKPGYEKKYVKAIKQLLRE